MESEHHSPDKLALRVERAYLKNHSFFTDDQFAEFMQLIEREAEQNQFGLGNFLRLVAHAKLYHSAYIVIRKVDENAYKLQYGKFDAYFRKSDKRKETRKEFFKELVALGEDHNFLIVMEKYFKLSHHEVKDILARMETVLTKTVKRGLMLHHTCHYSRYKIKFREEINSILIKKQINPQIHYRDVKNNH